VTRLYREAYEPSEGEEKGKKTIFRIKLAGSLSDAKKKENRSRKEKSKEKEADPFRKKPQWPPGFSLSLGGGASALSTRAGGGREGGRRKKGLSCYENTDETALTTR